MRPDLHALTDQQLQDIFKIGRDQADSHELIEGGREQYPRLLYIWLVTIAAGFGAAIGAVKAMPFMRRRLRTLAVPVEMKDQKLTPPAADQRFKMVPSVVKSDPVPAKAS